MFDIHPNNSPGQSAGTPEDQMTGPEEGHEAVASGG